MKQTCHGSFANVRLILSEVPRRGAQLTVAPIRREGSKIRRTVWH